MLLNNCQWNTGILTCLYFSSSYIHYSSLVNIERSWAEPSGLNIRYIPALKHIGYIPAVKIILNDRWSAVITTRGCCRELLGCWALFCILSSQQGGALTCWPLQTLETFNFDIDVVNPLLDESIYFRKIRKIFFLDLQRVLSLCNAPTWEKLILLSNSFVSVTSTPRRQI